MVIARLLLGLVLEATMSAGDPAALGYHADGDVPPPSAPSQEDEALAARLTSGENACGVWRSRLRGGALAVLVASCSGPSLSGPAKWTLHVVGEGSPPRRLASAVLGKTEYHGCGARGSLDVREDVLKGESVIEVAWGCRSEGDGKYPSVELWRWAAGELGRVFTMPSTSGNDPEGVVWGVWWRPGQTEDAATGVDVMWQYGCDAENSEHGWRGEQHLLYRFDGKRFRPPPGAVVLASSWATDWLPRSRVSDYSPPNAFDGQADTAWCARSAPGLRLSVGLAEATRLEGLRILPGYAKTEATFRDNTRLARVGVRTYDDNGKELSFEASLSPDKMDMQFVPVPARAGRIQRIEVTILATKPGARFQDVCVSEIKVLQRGAQ